MDGDQQYLFHVEPDPEPEPPEDFWPEKREGFTPLVNGNRCQRQVWLDFMGEICRPQATTDFDLLPDDADFHRLGRWAEANVCKIIGGMLTSHCEHHDITTPEGVLVEVKCANVNTKSWTFTRLTNKQPDVFIFVGLHEDLRRDFKFAEFFVVPGWALKARYQGECASIPCNFSQTWWFHFHSTLGDLKNTVHSMNEMEPDL